MVPVRHFFLECLVMKLWPGYTIILNYGQSKETQDKLERENVDRLNL